MGFLTLESRVHGFATKKKARLGATAAATGAQNNCANKGGIHTANSATTDSSQAGVACSLPLSKRVLLQRGWRMSEFGAVLIREKTAGPPRESKIVKSVVSTIRKTVSTEGPTRLTPFS